MLEGYSHIRMAAKPEAATVVGYTVLRHDEKPGIQALAVTTPDRRPVAGQHTSHLGITNMTAWARCRCWPARTGTAEESSKPSATRTTAPTSSPF
jgi:hypothetical protein